MKLYLKVEKDFTVSIVTNYTIYHDSLTFSNTGSGGSFSGWLLYFFYLFYKTAPGESSLRMKNR